MGNDGGSIPKRRELVKEAARSQTASEVKESQQEQQEHSWSTCPISQRRLKAPVVSDCAGVLYNKDAVIEYLLPADDAAAEVFKADQEKLLQRRVKSLKDVVEVKLQVEEGEDRRTNGKSEKARWVCPITNKSLGAAVKSVYIVPCGHAFAEVALKEVTETNCLQCGEPYSTDNVISILPLSPTEKARLTKRADSLKEQGLTHSLKKASGSGKKKRKKDAVEADDKVDATKVPTKAPNGTASSNGINNAATASLTARVLAEEQEKAKRRKLEDNKNLKSLFSTGPKGPQKDTDFMTRGHSAAAETGR